jgi:hypothetical protein
MTNDSEARSSTTKTWDIFTPSYLFWTIPAFLLAFISGELDRIFNLYWLLDIIVVLPIIIFFITQISIFLINLFKFRWRRVISIIAAPLICGAFLWAITRLHITPEFISFELTKSRYLEQVAQLPVSNDGPSIKIWQWGETGGVGTIRMMYYIVYDDSDEIKLRVQGRSLAWKMKAQQAANGNFYSVIDPDQNNHISIVHLDGHFFLVIQSFY